MTVKTLLRQRHCKSLLPLPSGFRICSFFSFFFFKRDGTTDLIPSAEAKAKKFCLLQTVLLQLDRPKKRQPDKRYSHSHRFHDLLHNKNNDDNNYNSKNLLSALFERLRKAICSDSKGSTHTQKKQDGITKVLVS